MHTESVVRQPGRWEQAPRSGHVQPAPDCPLPQRMRQHGAKLLNQQFWLWGQDVRHAPNLLALHGFTSQRPPEGCAGSPGYTMPDHGIALWGFGMLAQFADRPAIYVNRFCCEPRIPRAGVAPQHVWLPEHLSPLAVPGSHDDWCAALRGFAQTVRWIIAYEQWVTATTGPEYRVACLARWPRTVCRANEMIPAWEWLAQICEQLAANGEELMPPI